MSERNAVLAQMLAQPGQPAAPQQDRGLLSRLLGGPSSPIDGAPMYAGGPQMSNQMPAQNFAPAPQTFTDYAARAMNPQTPDERMQAGVVRGFAESPATTGRMTKEAFQAMVQQARDNLVAYKTRAEALSAAGKPVRLVGGRNGAGLVGPDMSKPGGYRLTHFVEGQPAGHTEYKSMQDALLDAFKQRYTVKPQP